MCNGTGVGRFSLFQWEPLWFSVRFSEWELKVFILGDNLFENLLVTSCSSENWFSENLKRYQLNFCVITFKGIKNIWAPVFRVFNVFSVNWSVIEHLKAQGRLDPRGRLCCFWCSNKTWISPLGTFNTLIIIENEWKMRKLWPPKQRGQKLKKTNQQTFKKPVLKHPKNSLYCSFVIRVSRWFVKL